MPPLIDRPRRLRGAAGAGELSPVARRSRPLDLRPQQRAATRSQEIDPHTYRIVRQFARRRGCPQHVVPSYDLRTLWVTNDIGNSLTPINPRNGVPGRPVPVADPYNMYFTPDGRYAW